MPGRAACTSARQGLPSAIEEVFQPKPCRSTFLRFQPVENCSSLFEKAPTQLSTAVITHALAVGQCFAQSGWLSFQLQIAVRYFRYRSHRSIKTCPTWQIGQALQKQNALDQHVGVLHSSMDFVILVNRPSCSSPSPAACARGQKITG